MTSTYRDLHTKLGGRQRRKLENNTYAVAHEDRIEVVLHETPVVTHYEDGRVRLDSGGYLTQVTLRRINDYTPSGVRVRHVKGVWRVDCWVGIGQQGTIPFADGLTFGFDLLPVEGTYPDPETEARLDSARQRLARDIKAFLTAAEPVFTRWQQELRETRSLRTSGDCLYCQGSVTTPDGEPFGGTDHLWSHLREQYVFPTLFVNAYRDKGYKVPQQTFGMHVLYGHTDDIGRVLTGYLRKHLGTAASPELTAESARLARYAESAREALRRPSDFGYFGDDETLWQTSAPTWTKHRDSENIEIANFRIVWEALTTEFPDLVAEGIDDEGYVGRGFAATSPGAIYVFGAGHWAVGHIDQIVVPVVREHNRPTAPDNLHPAFIRVCEFMDAVQAYPALEGAEEMAADLDHKDAVRGLKRYLADNSDENAERVLDAMADEGIEWEAAETEEIARVIAACGLTAVGWLAEEFPQEEQTTE